MRINVLFFRFWSAFTKLSFTMHLSLKSSNAPPRYLSIVPSSAGLRLHSLKAEHAGSLGEPSEKIEEQ